MAKRFERARGEGAVRNSAIGARPCNLLLYNLEGRGQVKPVWRLAPGGRRRKYYRITPAGRAWLQSQTVKARGDLAELRESIRSEFAAVDPALVGLAAAWAAGRWIETLLFDARAWSLAESLPPEHLGWR